MMVRGRKHQILSHAKSLALAALVAWSLVGHASPVQANAAKWGTSTRQLLKPEGVELVIGVLPMAGMKIDLTTPWSLKVRDKSAFQHTKTSYDMSDLDPKIPGFRILIRDPPKDGTWAVDLVAAVCKDDGSSCVKETEQLSGEWSDWSKEGSRETAKS